MYKSCTLAVLFSNNSTSLLNTLKNKVGQLNTIVTYNDDGVLFPDKNKFAVIRIYREQKEYRGFVNVYNKIA